VAFNPNGPFLPLHQPPGTDPVTEVAIAYAIEMVRRNDAQRLTAPKVTEQERRDSARHRIWERRTGY
jgi:hypothetical protein